MKGGRLPTPGTWGRAGDLHKKSLEMSKAIAILMSGSATDLAAVFQGVELARRTGIRAYAFFPAEKHPSLSRQIVVRLGDRAGIRLDCHLLESGDETELYDVIRIYRIFCLVVGTRDQTEKEQAMERLSILTNRLRDDRLWFPSIFWTMAVEPVPAARFEQALKKWSVALRPARTA